MEENNSYANLQFVIVQLTQPPPFWLLPSALLSHSLLYLFDELRLFFLHCEMWENAVPHSVILDIAKSYPEMNSFRSLKEEEAEIASSFRWKEAEKG